MESNKRPPQYTSKNLKEKEAAFIKFIQLLEDTTRMKIFLLFLLYKRLSLTQLSEAIHRTKPAITHQINKFIDIGIIRVIKLPVQGSTTANYYELIGHFFSHAVDREDPSKLIPKKIIKEMEVLQIRAEKEAFKFTSNIYAQIAKIYEDIEKRAKKIEEHFGNNIPPFNLTISPLTRKAIQVYNKEMIKVNSKISKIMNEENKKDFVERPYIYITTIFPLKEFYSNTYRD
ncbi:MAG: winged helix-turn-helix domain-containing protein [Promethearchaeota archaeon]